MQRFDCVFQADVKHTWPQTTYEPVAASISAG